MVFQILEVGYTSMSKHGDLPEAREGFYANAMEAVDAANARVLRVDDQLNYIRVMATCLKKYVVEEKAAILRIRSEVPTNPSSQIEESWESVCTMGVEKLDRHLADLEEAVDGLCADFISTYEVAGVTSVQEGEVGVSATGVLPLRDARLGTTSDGVVFREGCWYDWAW